MDRHELRHALLAAGLSPQSFSLAGVHEQHPLPVDFWFLRPIGSGATMVRSDGRSGDGWEIGSYERGVYDVRQVFATEAEACAAFYQALTGRPAPT